MVAPEAELQIYNNHNNSIDDPRYVAYFKRFLDDAVIPFCGGGRKGLDFGSGPSPVLAEILERDYGYSMDIYDLFFASDRVYEDKRYDLVTSTEVVEHLENPMDHFQLFRNLLKEDGLLAIMTQFHPKDDDEFMEWHYIRDKSHISFYTPKTMAIIGKLIGLKIVYTDDIRYTSYKAILASDGVSTPPEA